MTRARRHSCPSGQATGAPPPGWALGCMSLPVRRGRGWRGPAHRGSRKPRDAAPGGRVLLTPVSPPLGAPTNVPYFRLDSGDLLGQLGMLDQVGVRLGKQGR